MEKSTTSVFRANSSGASTMLPAYERMAHTYLLELYVEQGWSAPVPDDQVHRLARLLFHAAAEARQACMEIAEEMMRVRSGRPSGEQVWGASVGPRDGGRSDI